MSDIGLIKFIKSTTGTTNTASIANIPVIAERKQSVDSPRPLTTTLVDLPNEIILIITGFLKKESQLLLSLSCKRLRILLNYSLDLALYGKSTKVRFLHLLERDHPGYLTCQSCVVLYSWREREGAGYQCPGLKTHQVAESSRSTSWLMQAGGKNNVRMTQETIDLIFRGLEHGLAYGLPLSFLNTSGTDALDISRTNEARLVNGQLLVASRVEVEVWSYSERPSGNTVGSLDMDFCIHMRYNMNEKNARNYEIIEKIWLTVEQAVARVNDLERFQVYKCDKCQTDHELRVTESAKNRARIVLNVWRNYGRRDQNRLSIDQHFCRQPMTQFHANIVSRRDLRQIFESEPDWLKQFRHSDVWS